jgi:hypothetical protein
MEHEFPDGRGWVMVFNRNDCEDRTEIGVHHMFNSAGEETFDFSDVTHIDTDAGMFDLRPGDELTFTLNSEPEEGNK